MNLDSIPLQVRVITTGPLALEVRYRSIREGNQTRAYGQLWGGGELYTALGQKVSSHASNTAVRNHKMPFGPGLQDYQELLLTLDTIQKVPELVSMAPPWNSTWQYFVRSQKVDDSAPLFGAYEYWSCPGPQVATTQLWLMVSPQLKKAWIRGESDSDSSN